MIGRETAVASHRPTARESELSSVYGEGIVAGLLGAATVALWFLVIDTINGHPLYTPTVLGTAVFRGGAGLAHPETLPVSFEMVLSEKNGPSGSERRVTSSPNGVAGRSGGTVSENGMDVSEEETSRARNTVAA